MPRISEFFGIAIYIHWREHGPPHFHAVYGEFEASIAIEDAMVLNGSLPPRVLGLVIEWATLRRVELRVAWVRAQSQQPLEKIDPLR